MAQGKATVTERTVELLREAILSCELRPGEPLNQEQLAERFGVSLTPLREALKLLASDGLLVIYPNRGTVVAPLTTSEVLETFELRYFVETTALRASIPVMTERDFNEARELVSADKLSNGKDSVNAGLAFHYRLCLPCNQNLTLRVLRILHKTSERYLRIFYVADTPTYIASSLMEHEKLLSLCMKKNIDKALKFLHLHLSSTFTALAEHFRSDMSKTFNRPFLF